MAPNKLGRNFTAAVLNPIWLGHVFSQMPERSSVTNALNWLRSGPNGDRPRTLGGDGTGVKARFGKQALSTMTRAAPPTRARWTGAVTSQSASCCVPTRKLPVSGSSASARQSDAPCVRHSPRWWSRFHRRSRPGPRRERFVGERLNPVHFFGGGSLTFRFKHAPSECSPGRFSNRGNAPGLIISIRPIGVRSLYRSTK